MLYLLPFTWASRCAQHLRPCNSSNSVGHSSLRPLVQGIAAISAETLPQLASLSEGCLSSAQAIGSMLANRYTALTRRSQYLTTGLSDYLTLLLYHSPWCVFSVFLHASNFSGSTSSESVVLSCVSRFFRTFSVLFCVLTFDTVFCVFCDFCVFCVFSKLFCG